jgi:hypothetical protein
VLPTPPDSNEPRIALLLHSRADVRRAADSFMQRKELTVRVFEHFPELLAALEPDRTQLLLVDLHIARGDLETLASTLRRPAYASVDTILITSKAERPDYWNRVSLVPRARLIAGGSRFVPRLIEAIAEGAGAKHRVHLRTDLALKARLSQRMAAGDAPPVELSVVNLSESGMKVAAHGPSEIGSDWVGTLSLPSGAIALKAHVVRVLDEGDHGWSWGMQFVDLAAQDALTLRAVVSGLDLPPPIAPAPPEPDEPDERGEPVRSSPRIAVPSRLQLKARVQRVGTTQRLYLDVSDVSEAGFRGVTQYSARLEPQTPVDAMLLWPGHSVEMSCEVVHARVVLSEPMRFEYGFRFVTVSRQSRQLIKRVLSEAKQRGLKGQTRARAAAGTRQKHLPKNGGER